MTTDMVRAWVETLIERFTETEKAEPDSDGDYRIWIRNAEYYVRVRERRQPVVQIFAIAVDRVDRSPDLALTLNEINSELTFCRAFWVRGQVLIEADLLGTSIDEDAFRTSAVDIAAATDSFAPDLAKKFGGTLNFHENRSDNYSTPADERTGLYL